jgi:large subunit ribosomal protein L21
VYAIIEDGAHQYRVEEGRHFDIQLPELEDGQKQISFDKVLLVGAGEEVQVGQPYVEGATVSATIEGEIKGDKISVIKFRRRKNYRRKQGHRQLYLRVKVDKIEA